MRRRRAIDLLELREKKHKMDYSELAIELLRELHSFYKVGFQKNLEESLKGEAFALQYIAEHEEEVLPSKISSEMNVTSSRIAQTLNSIENKGYIIREIDKDDRRRVLVKLTPEGRKEAEKHREKVLAAAAEILESLGEHDAKEYIRIISRLTRIAPGCETLQKL